MAPITIFLSHVTPEARLADIVEGHVLRDFIGLARVFASSDQGSILAGSKWLDEMTSALKQANLHIVIASPDSVERKWINFEAGAAHVRGVPIIPLCHSGLTPAQLPVPLSESQGLVLSGDSGFRGFYVAIARALGSDLPNVDYAEYGREVAAFEATYSDRNKVVDAARTLGSSTNAVHDPRALSFRVDNSSTWPGEPVGTGACRISLGHAPRSCLRLDVHATCIEPMTDSTSSTSPRSSARAQGPCTAAT